MSKKLSRLLSIFLVLVLLVSAVPLPASAKYLDWGVLRDRWSELVSGGSGDSAQETSTEDEFLRIVHIDCGRKYFSVDDLKTIIDYAEASHYTHVELAFGNDGLRFLPNDLSVTASGVTYDSDAVKSAIQTGNKGYKDFGTNELTQADMDSICAYAAGKGIGIIPMLDIPGHTNALVTAMQTLGVPVDVFTSNTNSEGITTKAFSVDNDETIAFVTELVKKYVDYFARKNDEYFAGKSNYFNLAADECGYDDFTQTEYTKLADMLSTLSDYIAGKGMTTLLFNDGFRTNGYLQNALKDRSSQIMVCYWTYSGFTRPTDLAADFKLINTHNKWYYVAGNESNNWNGYLWAISNMNGSYRDCTVVDGASNENYQTDTGCMIGFWCDNPGNSVNYSNLQTWIKTLAENNPSYFVKRTTPVEEPLAITGSASRVKPGETLTLTVNRAAAWSVDNERVVTLAPADDGLSAEVTAVGTGSANIRAVSTADASQTAEYVITVSDSEAETTTKVVELYVGSDPYVDVQKGQNNASDTDRSGLNEDIAAVDVLGEDSKETLNKATGLTSGSAYYISDGSGNYLTLRNDSLTNTTDRSQATQWTATESGNRYTLQSGSYYLRYNNGLTVTTSWYYATTWSYSSDRGFGCSVRSGWNTYTYYLTYSDGWKAGRYPSSYAWAYELASGAAQTTVTITPVSAGTTWIRVGSVVYQITVKPEDLTKAAKLPIQLWITNQTIEVDQDDFASQQTSGTFGQKKPQYLEISATEALNTPTGVPLSQCVPEFINQHYEYDGTWWTDNRYDASKQPFNFMLCKGTVLSSTNLQEIWGASRINSGTDFRYVRYYGGKWAVSSTPEDPDSWTVVTGTGSTVSSSACSEQIIAYYYMRTELTDEVTTNVVDWGDPYENYNATDYVLLDFAVMMESGTRVPALSQFPIEGKTLAYHCNGNTTVCGYGKTTNGLYRRIDQIGAVNSGEYEVYMITLTPTSDTYSDKLASSCTGNTAGSGIYQGTEKVIWVDNPANLGKFADQSLWYVSPSGNTAFTDTDTTGKYVGGRTEINNLEIYNRQGMLVTYYVRSTAETLLKVHYIDEIAGTEFHDYNISVQPGTFFDAGFGLGTGKNTLVHNTVQGINNPETVTAELKDIPQIRAEYRRKNYTCVRAVLSGDRTEAYLYYTFDDTESFVVDFGLPLEIAPEQVGNLQGATITKTVISYQGGLADITAAADGTVTYQLKQAFTQHNPDSFSVTYTGRGVSGAPEETATVTFTIYVYPASNILYEETFLSEELKQTGGTLDNRWTRVEAAAPAQQASKLSDTARFGYDPAAETTGRNGAWEISDLTALKASQYALTTDFYGNAFDLIGTCGPDTGRVLLIIQQGAKAVKAALVDTRYQDGTLEQVPLAHLELGEDALYTATIYASGAAAAADTNGTAGIMRSGRAYAADPLEEILRGLNLDAVDIAVYSMDGMRAAETTYTGVLNAALADVPAAVTRPEGTHVEIGGFRVYRTTDSTDAVAEKYAADEQNRTYTNSIDLMAGKVITAYAEGGSGSYAITDYEALGGPQNEIYLAPGQSITFGADAEELQISLRAVGEAVMSNVAALSANTELYYTLRKTAGLFTISNQSGGLLAVGNAKIPTGASVTTVDALNQSDVFYSVSLAMAAAPAEPEQPGQPEEPKPFAPAQFDLSGIVRRMFSRRMITLRITVSSDVAYVTVNGRVYTPSSFQLRRGSAVITVTDVVGSDESAQYTVVAYNADGVASEALVKAF